MGFDFSGIYIAAMGKISTTSVISIGGLVEPRVVRRL
jgi:hypothetical protein